MTRKITSASVSMRDIIYIGILLVTSGVQYGLMSAKIEASNTSFRSLETRFDKEVVPRAEHLQMNATLDARLLAIVERQLQAQKEIEAINNKLDRILDKKK